MSAADAAIVPPPDHGVVDEFAAGAEGEREDGDEHSVEGSEDEATEHGEDADDTSEAVLVPVPCTKNTKKRGAYADRQLHKQKGRVSSKGRLLHSAFQPPIPARYTVTEDGKYQERVHNPDVLAQDWCVFNDANSKFKVRLREHTASCYTRTLQTSGVPG